MVINRANSILAVVSFIASLLLANIASAENKTFIKEYTYMASDIDSKVSSRAIALEQVKRALLEQLGTYLISETEVKNYQLTQDQVTTLTAGIVSAEVIDEKWDGRTYYLKAMIAADPKEVVKSVDALRNDVQRSKELEESKKKAEEAMREVERLKKKLELVKADAKIQREYTDAIKDLSAFDWYDKGVAFQQSNNHRDAIEAYTKAIELRPKLPAAYSNRGVAYAILGNYQQAINDFDKAIELYPKYEEAYYNRGLTYISLGNQQQAINDYSIAIKLNSKYAKAYVNRGIAYGDLGKQQKAISDYNKAIKLNPNDAKSYFSRGLAYSKSENQRQAINDYDKAIKLNPKDAAAYYYRGLAYGVLENINMYTQNLKTAAKLGQTEAQEDLNSHGIEWQ